MTADWTRLSAGRLRAALAAHGAAPRKRHGQHFLVDDNLLAAVVRDGEVRPDDVVLEVGPGPGLLTRHLLAAAARVVAVEIDEKMAAVAGDLIEPELAERLEWTCADALAGTRAFSPAMHAAWPRCTTMVANLPYNIAAPLLANGLLKPGPGPRAMTVMIQREVAERLTARPGTREWGPLSVITSLSSVARVIRRVPAGAFWPPPRVESAVLGLSRKGEETERLMADVPGGAAAFQSFLAGAFHSRRKTLVNSLAESANLSSSAVLARLGVEEIPGRPRAEALDELELYVLARRWAQTAPGERIRPDP